MIIILAVNSETNKCLLKNDNGNMTIYEPGRPHDCVWSNKSLDFIKSEPGWEEFNKPVESMGGLSMSDVMML